MNGYFSPTVTANRVTVSKPEGQRTKEEELTSTCNFRALNAIYNGATMSEFRRISTCTIAKEAWDILQTVHEGTDTVKRSKLQKLNTAFENVMMEEDKTFDAFTLGDPIPQHRIVKKILRSLSKRFDAKVVTI